VSACRRVAAGGRPAGRHAGGDRAAGRGRVAGAGRQVRPPGESWPGWARASARSSTRSEACPAGNTARSWVPGGWWLIDRGKKATAGAASAACPATRPSPGCAPASTRSPAQPNGGSPPGAPCRRAASLPRKSPAAAARAGVTGGPPPGALPPSALFRGRVSLSLTVTPRWRENGVGLPADAGWTLGRLSRWKSLALGPRPEGSGTVASSTPVSTFGSRPRPPGSPRPVRGW
jgi:hypothetical protein